MSENRQPYLDVVIEKDGSVSIEGQNFVDASCADAMRVYKEQLGVVAREDPKREFFQQVDQDEREQIHQRG